MSPGPARQANTRTARDGVEWRCWLSVEEYDRIEAQRAATGESRADMLCRLSNEAAKAEEDR